MANNKKAKRGFFHKLTTNVEETAETTTATLNKANNTCHITKHNNYNKSNSSSCRSHCYSSTTICNMKLNNNNKTKKSKSSKSDNSFSSNICCNKGCTNNNSSISGRSICWPSLNLFYFSCNSPNSIITFFTTSLAKCMSNLQNLYCYWWSWWWWSLQQYKIKNKISYNSYASSSSSKDWQKTAALKTSSNNNKSSGGYKSSIKFSTSLKLYFFLWLFLSILGKFPLHHFY